MMATSMLNESAECLDKNENTDDHFPKADKAKCVCEKDNQVKYYCQDCRLYLCSTCSNHHTKFPVMANHRLQTVAAEVNPSLLCFIHCKPLEFYCIHCKTPICVQCTETEHTDDGGKHKATTISEAFKNFKERVPELKEKADKFTKKIEKCLKKIGKNNEKLEESKATCLKDIDNIVKELNTKINENGDEMKNQVETIYKKKKMLNITQTDELTKAITNVEKSLSAVNQIIMSDETTAMISSNKVYKALVENVNESLNTEPNDDGKIYFFKNMSSLQWECDIGNVTETMADHLALIGGEDVTQGQPIVVKVCKTNQYEIDANQIRATWTHPTGETNITQVEDDVNGDYTVTGKCTSPGICILDVSVDDKPVRQSPMKIKVKKEGLVQTTKIIADIVSDVLLYDDNHMLVSCRTKDIFRYTQSGEFIDKITLPEGVKVNRMYKIKNGSVAFSDYGNKCITLIDMNDQTIKSIGEGYLTNPKGIYVDESVVYIADWTNICVLNIDNGHVIRSIQQERYVPDITLTKEGNIIVLYDQNSNFTYYSKATEQCILQLLDNEFNPLENIVNAEGKWKPRGVVVDADDNIIISSENKLELFSNDGKFIKRIDKEENGINIPWGLSISNHPRRVVVANKGNATIQIYNY